MSVLRLLLIALVVASFTVPSFGRAQTATPEGAPIQPAQPAEGPGGVEYLFDEVAAHHYGREPDGIANPTGYWLFEPAAPLPNVRVGVVPLIFFFHGYYGTDPEHYRA